MKIKRPEQYYKVRYATDVSNYLYTVRLIAECLTLKSSITAYKEAVQINGWDDGVILVDLVEMRTGILIDRTEINVDDVRLELEGEI